MTTDHRREAEIHRELAGQVIGHEGRMEHLGLAQFHALLAIHDTLTAADRYAANEAKQREAEPDPLDEDDHQARMDRDDDIWVRHLGGCWHVLGDCCAPDCEGTLAYVDERYGPLAFAPEPPPEDNSTHYYHTDIDRAPDGTAWSWEVVECHCNRPWRHE